MASFLSVGCGGVLAAGVSRRPPLSGEKCDRVSPAGTARRQPSAAGGPQGGRAAGQSGEPTRRGLVLLGVLAKQGQALVELGEHRPRHGIGQTLFQPQPLQLLLLGLNHGHL